MLHFNFEKVVLFLCLACSYFVLSEGDFVVEVPAGLHRSAAASCFSKCGYTDPFAQVTSLSL